MLEVDSLQDLDLSALREDQHILIRVEHASARASEDDIAVLRRLSRRHEASVCVLAPFDVPEVYATLGLGWSPGRWELADGWRHTLIGWFIARAGTVRRRPQKPFSAGSRTWTQQRNCSQRRVTC
ncbi:MAG: hypothetical protein IPL19_20490 [Sandaracinaceae bacterium]|nr:hypothetical protein [Sandaracinaceae bacterium]